MFLVLSAFGYLCRRQGARGSWQCHSACLMKPGRSHTGLFGFGILSLYVVAALDVLVAWALYRVFKPVSGGSSRLAAGLRIATSAVFIVAISQLVGALPACTPRHCGRSTTFTNIWDAGLVLFGLSLFVLAYMAYKSVYVPKLLAVSLVIAGFGLYPSTSVLRPLIPGSSSDISAITGMGEFVFALWLGDPGTPHPAVGHLESSMPTRWERPDDLEK